MNVLLLSTILGIVAGQSSTPTTGGSVAGGPIMGGVFPDKCLEIININGTDSQYPLTSIARVFSIFCPVVNEFVDCLEYNLDFLKKSNFSVSRLLGDNFNSTIIKERISDFCLKIKDVADDLECVKNVTDIVKPCEIQRTYLTYEQGLTLNDFCGEMENISNCFTIAEETKICPRDVVEIHRSFMYLLIPPECAIPTYPTTEDTTVATIGTPPPVTIVMPTGPESVIIACAEETYTDLLKKVYQELSTGVTTQMTNVFKYIFEAVEDVCSGRSKFVACIEQRFKPPFMKVDEIIDKLLTDNAIGTALDQYCSLELTQQEEKCLQESASGMFLCSAMIYSIYGSSNTVVTGNVSFSSSVSVLGSSGNTITIPPQVGNTNPDYVTYLCPAINVVNQCIGIHLGRCSTTLGETFTNVNKQAFSPECQSAEPSKELLGSPVSSVLLMCGIPFGGEIQMEFLKLNQSYRTEQQVLDIIRDLIPAGCGYVDFYTTCISKRLPNSQNLFDKIATKLFDLIDASRLQRVFKAVCDETKEIQENFNCLVGSFGQSGDNCFKMPAFQTVAKKLQNIYAVDLNTLTDICEPIKDIGFCFGNLTSNCNKDLGQLTNDAVLEFLRIDCGGARPLSSSSPKNGYSVTVAVYLLLTFLFVF